MSHQAVLPGFAPHSLSAVVNVASVRHRSPFRYPGGKTWLVPRVQVWLASLRQKPAVFLEPFAGGAIVGLTVAAENLADQVVLVELDTEVAAVWHVLLSDENERLAQAILDFALSPASLDALECTPPATAFDLAFQTIVRNRTYHGGILAPGSGRIKYGENGKGLTSRWYPATLAKRMRDIARYKDRIQFIHGDGLEAIQRYASMPDAVAFVDPPYTAAGKRAGSRLYKHADLDHELLFRLMGQFNGDFLMTYDLSAALEARCEEHGFQFRKVAMSNTHHAEMKELLIGRDLAWCDSAALDQR